MVITYPNLQLCWHNPDKGICGQLENLPEIEKKKYGFNLLGGQKVYFIGYDIDRRNVVMLSQQRGDAQTHVASSRN